MSPFAVPVSSWHLFLVICFWGVSHKNICNNGLSLSYYRKNRAIRKLILKRVDNEDLLNNLQRATLTIIFGTKSIAKMVWWLMKKIVNAQPACHGRLCTDDHPIAVTRGFITHDEAVARSTLTTLRFLESPQGMQHNATGYKGFSLSLSAHGGWSAL
ncbi:MAG: hypothetical protein R2867_11205 [Caldilineaceae bacterium]